MARRTMRVSLALAVIDGLTGQPILGGVRVCLDNGNPAIRKPNGYWIFVNLPAGTYTVTIQAPFYQGKTLQVYISEEGTITQTALLPSKQFPFSQPVLWWEGTLPAQSPVWAAWEEETPRFRVIEPFAKGSRCVSLYVTGRAASTQWVWIRTQKGEGGVFALTPQSGSQGGYQLEPALPWEIDHTSQVIPALQVDGGDAIQVPMPAWCRCLYLVGQDGIVLTWKNR